MSNGRRSYKKHKPTIDAQQEDEPKKTISQLVLYSTKRNKNNIQKN